MNRTIRAFLAAILLLAAGLLWGRAAPAGAQAGESSPPTILTFTADPPTVALADAEAGQTMAALSWQVVGMAEEHRLLLDLYYLNGWASLVDEDDAPLGLSGSYPITVNHPLTFAPPTYRLRLVDAQGRTLDERTVSIAYDPLPEDGRPTIRAFTTTTTTTYAAELALGTSRVEVAWDVANRLPTANLVFEQVLPDGSAVSVELPRPVLWIPSAGQGSVAPVLPSVRATVVLRLSIVDMLDGTVYDEQTLTLGITGTVEAEAILPTAAPTVPAAPPEIVFFQASNTTADRDDEITFTWETRGGEQVWIVQYMPGARGNDGFYDNLPASGTLTVSLQNRYAYAVEFTLWVDRAGAEQVGSTVAVSITCPYTYFFGSIPETQGTCPLNEAHDVEAAYQPFQGGSMFWRGDTGDVFVLHNEGDWEIYAEGVWLVPGEEIPAETPPAGLFQPISGFGQVWARSARYRMGWATAPEQGYTMRVQDSAISWTHAWHFFFTTPDGRTIALIRGGNWRYIG